ncbi:MAG TPA: hypothetical protein ENF86_01535 [Firmicutes bacterium]|nr:hypothetical protein [Bacillota bacterium]
MGKKKDRILEIKEQVFSQYPDLVEIVREAREQVKQAREDLLKLGIRLPEKTRTNRSGLSWVRKS